LVQLNVTFRFGPGRPSPSLPELGIRLYEDGQVVGTESGGLVTAELSPDVLRHVRELLVASGLDQGERDYGVPTNVEGSYAFQVASAMASTVAIGGTVNDVPSSDTGIPAEQRAARGGALELADILNQAVRSGTPLNVSQWSRYARRMPDLQRSMPLDVAAYPQWKGTALDQGTPAGPDTYCVATREPKADSGLNYVTDFVNARIGDMPWYISYTPVIRGEQACALTPYG
jgi:hypothetical protein